MRMPKAVHVCHMTRIIVGAVSIEKTGTVTSLWPISITSKMRVTMSCCQLWVRVMPIEARREKTATMKMVHASTEPVIEGVSNLHSENVSVN